MNKLFRVFLVSALAVASFVANANAQSPTTVTPDRSAVLVNKDIGGQRWAISRNLGNGAVTGNVFTPGSTDPQFVYCEQIGESSSDYTYRCLGTGRCTVADCASDWDFISQVNLPKSFFVAGGSPPPTPVPSGCPSNGPITDLTRNCAGYTYFYQQSSVLFGLTTRGNVVATCFASDPSRILCVGGPVTSSSTANLELVNLNSGPFVALDAGGRLSIAGSSLRMNFSLDGTSLAVNASWIETDSTSSAGSKSASLDEPALVSILAEVSRKTLDSISQTSEAASSSNLSAAIGAVGNALGN